MEGVLDFLGELEASGRLYNVGGFDLYPAYTEDSGNMDMIIRLSAYSLAQGTGRSPGLKPMNSSKRTTAEATPSLWQSTEGAARGILQRNDIMTGGLNRSKGPPVPFGLVG